MAEDDDPTVAQAVEQIRPEFLAGLGLATVVDAARASAPLVATPADVGGPVIRSSVALVSLHGTLL